MELEGERATLLDYLRTCLLALELKCAGLADVERNWFRRRVMAQAEAPPLYWSDEVEDADWAGAVPDPAVVADAWRVGARRSPSRSSSSPAQLTSPSAALCKTARPLRCAR